MGKKELPATPDLCYVRFSSRWLSQDGSRERVDCRLEVVNCREELHSSPSAFQVTKEEIQNLRKASFPVFRGLDIGKSRMKGRPLVGAQ